MVRQVTYSSTASDGFIYPESDGQPMSDNTLQYEWIVKIKENLEMLFADRTYKNVSNCCSL